MLYKGLFNNWGDVLQGFHVPEGLHEQVIPLYATYDCEDYEGSATVVFVEDEKLYSVHGGHCSCNGLEDQFDPEEIPWEIAEKFFTQTYYVNGADLVWLVSIVRDVLEAGDCSEDVLRPLLVWHRLGH